MIRTALLLGLLPAAALAPVLAPALAQVSVNQGALDQLKPSAPVPAAQPQAKRPPVRQPRPAHAVARATQPPPAPAPKPKPKPVTVAPAAPQTAVLPPAPAVPHAAPPLPPPVPVLPGAAGEAAPIPGGLRVTFGAGTADFNPATDAALVKFARDVAADPAIDLNVFAYAAGPQDDPSTPRRVSLSRALAARAVLISEGIVSTRIYVRALGATASDGPPDRVDVMRGGTQPGAKP